ncbi:hypothetical protein DERP_006809 [Dermatophagoides pteronyssinus]|uniref:Uncharacterized protein n=1 Tax=Dermatophagoides pteronyssinus TaxID=6956 RepID=A0ABQ8IS21_DERPT|nr:hypothetical protein DERP_006809 [Dermatophagoides pteronyssinus]
MDGVIESICPSIKLNDDFLYDSSGSGTIHLYDPPSFFYIKKNNLIVALIIASAFIIIILAETLA